MKAKADPDAMARMLCSPLMTDEEIGDLATLTMTLRANQNGGTHAIGCRNLSSKAAAPETVTIAAYRAANPPRHPCRVCGGGVIEPLTDEQGERVQALGAVWKTRVEQERENAIAQQRQQERIRRADVIDERASRIVRGWPRDLERERARADGYPEGVVSAEVTCPDCGAVATVTFEPRAVLVRFRCPQDARHGFVWLGQEDDKPMAVWDGGGRDYIAIAMVAPVLAGDDDTWSQVYGTRADDYLATVEALAAFAAANPEPMQLTPDVRCADCGNKMSLYVPDARSTQRMTYSEYRMDARYSCSIRHEDGRYRSRKKAEVDAAIDEDLLRLLRRHPSWATAPEIEPSPAALARYADYLTSKIEIYDAYIGAVRNDPGLSRQRAQWESTLRQVDAMREEGSFAAAGLRVSSYRSYREEFTDLARALLTSRVDVGQAAVRVFTHFDAGTSLYRTLRAREIREELADLQRRQHELTGELTELGD